MVSSVTTQPREFGNERATDEGPLTNLRGAKLGLDARRVGMTLGSLCVIGLLVLIVSLFVAGANRNSRINDLRQHGVPIQATVTGCLGLLGGSGSNAAGYTCTGTFVVDGHRYTEGIPGNTLYAKGSHVSLITVAGNPGLVATPTSVATDRASWRVFILPTALSVGLLAAGGLLGIRRRRRVTHV